MDCTTDDYTCGLTPVIPSWAQWAAFIAATIIVFVVYTKAQRQPQATLRIYLAAVRPQLLSPANRSRRWRMVIAVMAAMGLLLIQPSKEAVTPIRERLRSEMRALRGTNALAVIRKMNPIIRGWAAYYRTVASSKTFRKLDRHMWTLIMRWGERTHPKKSRRWIYAKYMGRFHPGHPGTLTLGDRETGSSLLRFSWTTIARHRMVMGRASPDDPTLTAYWTLRRKTACRYRSDRASCACSYGRTGDAQVADSYCSSPTLNRKAPRSGKCGFG